MNTKELLDGLKTIRYAAHARHLNPPRVIEIADNLIKGLEADVTPNEEAEHLRYPGINVCFDFLIGYAKEGLDTETTIDGLRNRLTRLRKELIDLRNRYNNEVI